MQTTLTRQELYDLVWSTPIATLATQFDLSEPQSDENMRTLPDITPVVVYAGHLRIEHSINEIDPAAIQSQALPSSS